MKEIFEGHPDFTKSSFLNWRTSKKDHIQNILAMAEGFLSSAIQLAKVSLDDNQDKKADMLVFPMLANANHGIELYLKALNWTLNILAKSERRLEGGHDIKKLLEVTRKRIKDLKGESSLHSFDETTGNLQVYVSELYIRTGATPKDDKMDFSRYPISGKSDHHFYIDELNNVEIDLENFVCRFTEIMESLDTVSWYYYDQELNQNW